MFYRTSRLFRTPLRRSIKTRSDHSFLVISWRMCLLVTCLEVSWALPSLIVSDHPPGPSLFGEGTLSALLAALTANPAQWAKTALFVAYDENGGFFDHVPPMTAPPGTPGEYVTAPAVPDPTQVGNPAVVGPIGLGFRVPILVISPFSRGGFVPSDLFDHTSILRFLEARFGAEVPNLSAWRRATVGDLTSAFSFAEPDASVPNLPSTTPGIREIIQQCVANLVGTTPYLIPNPQSLPPQEADTAHRPGGAGKRYADLTSCWDIIYRLCFDAPIP
jgi:phospholipase C